MTLGRLVIHGQPTTLSRFRSTPSQIQGIYGYVKKTIISNWIQSNLYLSEMLSKHWDLFKILPMITNLHLTCGPTTFFPRSAFIDKRPCCPNTWVIYHTILKFPSSTHTKELFYISLIIHVSTRACHIHHQRGVTEVWHIAHFWVSYGRCATPGSPMVCSEGFFSQ